MSVRVDVHYSMERICFKSSAAVEATSKTDGAIWPKHSDGRSITPLIDE